MKRMVLGMLAHVDSGKTTLCEEMLFRAGMIREKGRVDHGDAFLDNEGLEKKRGITIFSKQAVLELGDSEVTLIDTPGHTDLSSEMERALSAMDAAVLIIGANDGIMPYTRTLFSLLESYGIPTILFVNKMDLAIKKRSGILEDLRNELAGEMVMMERGMTERAIEEISLFDDDLTELILEGKERGDLEREVMKGFMERMFFPVFFGSALKGEGVEELLDLISNDAYDKYLGADKEELKGRVFKISHDRGERLTFIKLISGTITPREKIKIYSGDNDPSEEKINEIRKYSGDSYKQRSNAYPGEVVAVTGLKLSRAGFSIGRFLPVRKDVMIPYMTYTVLPDDPEKEPELRKALGILSLEDPGLSISEKTPGEGVDVSIMGSVQTEVLTDVLRERFGIGISLSERKIIYKETITGEVEGVGHFDPLRHYAEVHLIMSPAERGSGITVRSTASEDDLDRNWQNLILHHITERAIKGVLIGAEVTDIEIELVSGRANKKHTEGGDFREATWRALGQGLMQARENGLVRILEPIMSFEVRSDTDTVGRIMTDIENMGGSFTGPVIEGDRSMLSGKAPARGMSHYGEVLRGYAGGDASLSISLAGYDITGEQDALISEYGYDPERDTDHTADSVFCSRGSSDIVPWNSVFSKMHLKSELEERLRAEGAPGNTDSDEILRNQALMEKRKREYRERLATDNELMAIFERTYGPVRKRPLPDRETYEKAEEKRSSEKHKKKAVANEERRTYIFVDGYNLIHAWPELKDLSDTDYGAARDRLTDIMCNYSAFMGVHTVLVFDAYKVTEGRGSSMDVHGIRVVYTREHETADAYIEKTTHEIQEKEQGRAGITVVSSDALVQQLTLGHGALRISSREFVEEVHRVQEMIRNIE